MSVVGKSRKLIAWTKRGGAHSANLTYLNNFANALATPVRAFPPSTFGWVKDNGPKSWPLIESSLNLDIARFNL